MGMAAGRLVRPRWQVVSALGVFQILAWGSSYYLLAVLALPIATDTGWPLPWVIAGVTIGLLVSALSSPRIGATIGRHGGRSVLSLGAVLLAGGLAAVGGAPNLPTFLTGWAIIGLGMGMGLYDPAFATLGRLYGANARSAITRLTLWGGFASTVCWPLQPSWRNVWDGTCFFYATLHLGVCLPLLLRFVPVVAPGPRTELSVGSAGPADEASRRNFLLLVAFAIASGTIMGLVSVHLLTLLQAQGETLATAVSLGALIGPSQVAARVLEMANRERHHPIWTLRAGTFLVAIGIGIMAFGTIAVVAAVVLYGAGNGILSIARGTVPLALFGPHDYASAMDRLARPAQIAQALAPSLGAALMTQAGTNATLVLLAILALSSAATAFLIRRPQVPTSRTNSAKHASD